MRITVGCAVLRFTTFASARAAIRYYVERSADCAVARQSDSAEEAAGKAVDYYGETGRTIGQWAGSGAQALGLSGPITPAQVQVLERLLSGQLPDGTVVGRPVWRPHPDSRLAVGPLLDALETAAAERGVPVAELVTDPKVRGEVGRLSSRLAHDPKAVAGVQVLAGIATAAGVNVGAVYGPGRIAVAHAQSDVQVDVRRAGADGAISAPKSASLLWAFTDPSTSAEVLAAHRAAVGESVAYLERWASHALRGHQGDGHRAAHIDTDGLIVAAFEHLTSRADDPQLHTHLVIANLTHGADGRWSALDTRALFRAQRTAGYLYQAVLRGELTGRLGVRWGPVRNGMAEIASMPTTLLREFSTRRRAIEDHLDRTGSHGAGAAQVACLATRPAKSGRTVTELRDSWWGRAAAHVRDPRRLVATVTGRARPRDLRAEALAGCAEVLFGPAGVTEKQSSFDRGELTRALLELIPAGTGLTHQQVEAAVETLLADERVLPLLTAGDTRRWTTTELAHTELATLAFAESPTAVPVAAPVLDHGLSPIQQRAVAHLATSPATVDVVLGPAGAGKTAMLAALHHHYRSLEVPVLGACVAAVAARRLEHATAIPSTSIARLLHRIDSAQPLPEQCVVVVDEAGMVGTRNYHQLVAAVTAVGGKLVPVGDRAQLPEIEAGGMFAHLAQHHLRAELTDNHRQRRGWECAALTTLRAGDVPRALSLYDSHDRLHHHNGPDDLAAAIAGDYLDTITSGVPVDEVVALAATRTSSDALNRAIRSRLQHAQLIGPDQPAGNNSYAVGELVMITRNDHRRGLLNGQRGTIIAVYPQQVTLHVDGRQVTVPAGWANDRLTPAYALTVHKAQGLTVDVALVDATGLTDRNTGYVAFSRARHRTDIHHHGIEQLADALTDDPFTATDGRRLGQTADLAARITRHREQQLATDQQPAWRREAARTAGRVR
jgi:conjugative relaxase-like TrwC/TraI family protein